MRIKNNFLINGFTCSLLTLKQRFEVLTQKYLNSLYDLKGNHGNINSKIKLNKNVCVLDIRCKLV